MNRDVLEENHTIKMTDSRTSENYLRRQKRQGACTDDAALYRPARAMSSVG
jgi:hypothetical protein